MFGHTGARSAMGRADIYFRRLSRTGRSKKQRGLVCSVEASQACLVSLGGATGVVWA